MLKTLRKNTKSIIWFIIISFCLWGAFSVGIQFNQRGQIAGRVFGRPVSYQEFNKFVKASEIFSLTGERVEDPGILHQHAWQNVIFSREARRQRIKVSDDEVRDEIKRMLDAQKIAADSAVYEGWVRSVSGAAPRDFEEMVREMLRIQKLLREVRQAPMDAPDEAEVRKSFLLEKRKVEAEIVSLPDAEAAKNFRPAMLADENWRAKTGITGGPALEKIPLQSLRDWMLAYTLTEAQVQEIYTLPEGAVSDPVTLSSGRVLIFKITGKTQISETDYDAPGIGEKYREELLERKRYDRFLDWHINLIKRARFQDFMPQAT